jgi:RNA polymerase sigma-70 factor (ECF subfamily)
VDRSVEQVVDEILVMDCQIGRAEALEMLVSRWQKRLWQYAYNLTENTEAAWDITQESWLGIIRGIGRLDDPARFRCWAYRIVTNKANDWIKKTKAVKQTSIEEIQDHQCKDKKDTGVKELLQKLDIRKRAVLSLYYFEQLSVSEISVSLNIPEGTVKSRLYEARKELKGLWQKHFEK